MIKRIYLCGVLLFLITACSNSKETIINKLKNLDYQCKDNVCSMDQWMTGFYDSFDLNSDIIWSITAASESTTDYYNNVYTLNFTKDSLTIQDENRLVTCQIDPAIKKIKACDQNSNEAQEILDAFFQNLDQLQLTYEELK